MFPTPVFAPAPFAVRFAELLPEYLPGVDTGAFEPTDRRRCWNKTLASILTVIGKQDHGFDVSVLDPSVAVGKDQSSVLWLRDRAPLFVMTTGWGDRHELEKSLARLLAFKCPQKLLIYTCTHWQEAVLEQIQAALLRYPYHLEGERYLFLNLLGAENRFHLLSVDIPQNGVARNVQPHPIPGSPFPWKVH